MADTGYNTNWSTNTRNSYYTLTTNTNMTTAGGTNGVTSDWVYYTEPVQVYGQLNNPFVLQMGKKTDEQLRIDDGWDRDSNE
jgi:hypothetical protein